VGTKTAVIRQLAFKNVVIAESDRFQISPLAAGV
jgi:hypothetical protein